MGRAHVQSFGFYTYVKRRPAGPIPVRVAVYLFEVVEELTSWPERNQRQRSWFEISDAAASVDEPELQNLLRQLASGTSS